MAEVDAEKDSAPVATAPTVYGIETLKKRLQIQYTLVATAPTVYGIETPSGFPTTHAVYCFSLQQHLPFTVLKPNNTIILSMAS